MSGIDYLQRRSQGNGEKRKVIASFVLIMLVLCLTGYSWAEDVPFSNTGQILALNEKATPCGGAGIGHANPAADYCLDMEYKLDTFEREDGTQYSVCVFPDESHCDAWKFLDGRCGAQWSYCAQQGYEIITRKDGKNSYSPYYAVCIDGNGNEVGSVSDLMDQPRKYEGAVDFYRDFLPLKRESAAEAVPAVVGALPAEFDWRDFEGENWLTPVKDQSACGSCWAFSAVGAAEAAHNIAAGDPNLDLDLSEEYLNSNCTEWSPGSCCGGWHSSALDRIQEEGIPDEDCMPYVVNYYSTGACGCFPTGICDDRCDGPQNGGTCSHLTCPDDLCADADERLVTIEDYTYIANDRDQIKQALVETGPLSVALAMSGSFNDDGVYECPDNVGTNHCIVIVGYNDAGNYWIAKNSWGGGWNENGYFKVGYGECNIERDVYSVEASDAPAIPSITKGEPKGNFQAGYQTDEVTEPNTWRWAEHFYGLKHIDEIKAQRDGCGDRHIYVIGWHQNDLSEYLMKFGGDYSRLVIRGKADRPGPVKLKIYVDAEEKAEVSLTADNDCNQDVVVDIPGIPFGDHAIAVKFINDFYNSKTSEDRNLYLDGIKVESAPVITSLTHGKPKGSFGAGYQTDAVTEPGKWRWAEHYYGFKHIDQIRWQNDACGARHNYAIGWHQDDLIEYLMKFGGDYNRLELVGMADRPGPVELEIWIDGKKKTKVYLNKSNNCNQNVTARIDGLTYGTHAIAVKFVNDQYEPNKGADGDRNVYLDGIRVKK